MTAQIQNNVKDIYINSLNNCTSEQVKNPLPTTNINTNINSNSFSQENFFNELISSANYQESKNNSSFYNFSESIHSNTDNPNIVMNKDQLYQTFLLFQKFLNQNISNSNMSSNNISPKKNENQSQNCLKTSNLKIYNKDQNAIDEINERNEFEENNGENTENNDQSNGKIISKDVKENHNWNNNDFIKDENENNKEIIESKSHYNIINGKDILNNGANENMIFFDENKDKESNIVNKEDKKFIIQLNTNIQKRNNSDDIKNSQTKNSYDDIPIKCNKVKFIDLVEKKLADEQKFGNMSLSSFGENNIIEKQNINEKKEEENNNQNHNNINYSKKIKNKIKKEKSKEKEKQIEKSEREKERDKGKLLSENNKNNNISKNYSFDREETKILNENKNIFENSITIENNYYNTLNKSDKNQIKTIKIKDINKRKNDDIVLSKKDLNKLLASNYIEKSKNYKIDNFQICFKNDNNIINNKEKRKIENENNEIKKVDEKEHLLDQKMKELNKEMVKLKEERNKVNKIKVEYEKSMSKLNNDLYQFSQKRDEFEKYRKNELNKIKNDKKNIITESKNIKDIKNQSQALMLKIKKDKEIIDSLKEKISELQSLIKQKESNTIGINYSSNTFKYTNKKSGGSKTNNLAELELDCLNTNQIIDGYFGSIKNNTIRSMTNINNIFCNNKEERISKNDLEKVKELQNMSLTLKRNNSTNKNYEVIKKTNEVLNNINKKINKNSLTSSNLGNYMSEAKNMKNIINNEEIDSISKKILEKTQKNMMENKEILNERMVFSPQATRTSVGFGLKKISIKLNNTPKENIKITKKIYENKNKINKKNTYSKTATNNLVGSLHNNINNESNQISNSITNTTNKQIINPKKIIKERLTKKQNTNINLYNSNKIIKKPVLKQRKNDKNDIFPSKNKNNLVNKALKNSKKNENDNANLNNSANNTKKKKNFNNKIIGKDNSRNFNIKSKDKMNITDNNIINIKNYKSLMNNNNKKFEEYDFSIPKKYLNNEFKLVKSLKTDDKIINLYTNDKKEIIFKSGVKKEIYQDGHQIIYFINGDLKQIYPDGKSCYYFQESKTVQITLNNGMEIYKFENGQIEKHYPDGTKQILFNDGSERYIYNDGYEETYFSDGNVQKVDNKRNVIEEKIQDDEDE